MTHLKKFEQHKYNDFLSNSKTNEDDKYFVEDYMYYLKNNRNYFKNMDKKSLYLCCSNFFKFVITLSPFFLVEYY